MFCEIVWFMAEWKPQTLWTNNKTIILIEVFGFVLKETYYTFW